MKLWVVAVFCLGMNALAMPQPAVVCAGLLKAGEEIEAPRFVHPDLREPVELPFTMNQAPNSDRFVEIISDLYHQLPNERVFYFLARQEAVSNRLLSLITSRIENREEDMRSMVRTAHYLSIELMTNPFLFWFKKATNAPMRQKERAFLSGWGGLLSIVSGAALFVAKNPILNTDRFLYLAMANDRQIESELNQLKADFENRSSNPAHHLFRDYVFTHYDWRSIYGKFDPRLELDSTFQTLSSTASLYERIYRRLFPIFGSKENKREPLRVRMDLLSNTATGKSMLLVRTKPL